jgi:uncharacterized membrane protein (UPF0127 family)
VKAHFLAPLVRSGRERWTLVHRPSGRVIAGELHTAFDSASRRSGLLPQSAWPMGSGLIIAPCQAVHTVGMRFAIDVLLVNRVGRVVRVRERVRPWRIVAALTAFAAIELPAGTLAGTVRAGDELTVTPRAALDRPGV